MASKDIQSKSSAKRSGSTRRQGAVRTGKSGVAHAENLVAAITHTVSVKGQAKGFVDFLREQSVVGLAIGLVLGTQAKVLVDKLMSSFINPFIGLLLPGQGTLEKKVFVVTFDGKEARFLWGDFLSGLLTFVIVAAVIYYVFKGLGLDRLDKKKDAPK